MLLLRKPQLSATKVLDTMLSLRAMAVGRPKPISSETCRKAQMAHQEMKRRRNLYVESGDLAMVFAGALVACGCRGSLGRRRVVPDNGSVAGCGLQDCCLQDWGLQEA